MISPGSQDRKPYVIPVQCVPYRGMKDATLWKLIDQLVRELHYREMKVTGKLFPRMRLHWKISQVSGSVKIITSHLNS